MNERAERGAIPAPLGDVEPHAPLLTYPSQNQQLHKVITVENLLRSISGSYLHFNRVDWYTDFPGSDEHDGEQLLEDFQGNAMARFEKAPAFSAADYYNQSRARTYACCFSLENSDFIWRTYGCGSDKGKVCVVFHFGKLRSTINKTLESQAILFDGSGNQCCQIFSINYWVVEYVDWNNYRANQTRLPNPIIYTYLKDKQFSEEREVRISLSAIGIGQFVLFNDGSVLRFPPSCISCSI